MEAVPAAENQVFAAVTAFNLDCLDAELARRMADGNGGEF